MNPVKTSLRYPQVTLVLVLMAFLTGVVALFTMPRREDPKITIRTGIVAAVYPGATATEVEDQVTRKIEERLFRFAEIRRDKTYSTTRNGVVVINVELNKNVKDADEFWSKLRLNMAELKATELPQGVQGPQVDSDFGDTVAVLIAVHGGHYGPRELKDAAEKVESALREIPAVSKIKRIGDQQEQIVVSASSEKMAQFAVTPQKLAQVLDSRNAINFAGRVPAVTGKVTVNANGNYQSEEELRQTVVDVSKQGAPLHLGDMATIERVYKDPSEYARFSGEQTILLSVEMNEGNNIVSFGKTLRQRLKDVQPMLPPDVKLDLVADQPKVVSERIGDFFREFGIAILAVILVTMLLLPMRVALVSSVAIPVTVSVTFAVLNMMHVELQQVSIAALIVVLGMVVDDAIVIADNYVELLDHQLEPGEAAWLCATQMAVPVLTATLTIIASFLPMLMLSGSVGEFISSLPIAVAVALSTSFVVAMLLTPLTARFFIAKGLRDHEQDEQVGERKMTALDHMQRLYNQVIGWAMEHKNQVLFGGLGIFVAGVLALQIVPQQFFPLAERNQFQIDVWMPEGTRIEATDAVVKHIEGVLKQEKLVTNYASFLGESAPRFYYNVNPQPPASNYAQVLVNTSSVGKTPKLVEALREKFNAQIPEGRIYVKELQQGEVMDAPLEVRIYGEDLATLKALGDQVEDMVRHTRGAMYIDTNWHEDTLEAGLKVREEEASQMGLSHGAIAQQLAGGFEGAPMTTYWEGNRNVPVVLRIDEANRQSYEDVKESYVTSPVTGGRVPVSAVATLEPVWQPGRIVRRNGVREITVRAYPDGSRLTSQLLNDVRKQTGKMQLPPGYRIEYGGEFENQNETFSELVFALGVSMVLIFLILLVQFRTLLDPLIVMMAFPLALPGAAFGLLITRNLFGFTAFIGIVSLGGLVVRNSIILIDYVHERIREGVGLEQATLEAGERRLRPIFLTTMAAAVGVTPMIISGSSLWAPLASVIAFGLLGSMFFTLVVIPVLFVVVHRPYSGDPRSPMARLQKLLGGGGHAAASLLVVALLLASATVSRAEEPRKISLDEAVKLATEHSSVVKLARLKVREQQGKLTAARANYFPTVTNQSDAIHLGETEALTIPAGSLGTYPGDGAIPGKDIKIELGKQNSLLSQTVAAQPITQFFKIHAGVSAARADERSAQDDVQRAEEEVAAKMKALYWNLLALERKKAAAELHIAAGEAKLAEAHEGVTAGTILEVKELEGRAQIAEARHGLGQIEDGIHDLEAEFDDLTGVPLETAFELETPSEVAEAAPESSAGLEAEAIGRNPEVAAARELVAKAKSGVAAARAAYIPEIGVYGQYIFQNGVPLFKENTATVGFRMNWTLGEFGKRQGDLRASQAQQAQAEENLRHVENRLRIDLAKELRRLHRAEEGVASSHEALVARRELRRITADEVAVKTANLSALKEAEAQLAEAEAQFADAEKERATAAAELARSRGME